MRSVSARTALLVPLMMIFLVACPGKEGAEPPAPTPNPTTTYDLSGTVTYDWVPARSSAEGGNRLDYAAKAARPARRVVVAAVSNGQEIATGLTNDAGAFTLKVPEGRTVLIRAKARTIVSSYAKDGIAPDHCEGGSWDIRVVNNVTGDAASRTDASLRPLYAADGTATYSEAATGADLHIPLTYTTSYTSRAAAPFAMLDTFVSQLELVCQGAPEQAFPSLLVNWSADNTNIGSVSSTGHLGQIGTSLYTTESATGPNLYILGKENVDTDEYDDHVVAHEFGHYVENNIYRSDSPGGSHTGGDSLDPRLAFGEAYGYAFAAMTFGDPIAVDTGGASQAQGFEINAATAPQSNDAEGIYDEFSVMHILWKLFDNRDGVALSGDYSRIHTVLRNDHRVQAPFTTLHTFVAAYFARFGETADGLRALWETTLDQPWNSLCVGACTGTNDVIDLFDVDNDIGAANVSAGRKYKQGGSTRPAEFWRLYRTLSLGDNLPTAHDQTLQGGYSLSDFTNKLGGIRWYRYVHSGATVTRRILIKDLGSGLCSNDILDMYIMREGDYVGYDQASSGSTAGCPSATFTAQDQKTYVIEVRGKGQAIPSWTVEVQ